MKYILARFAALTTGIFTLAALLAISYSTVSAQVGTEYLCIGGTPNSAIGNVTTDTNDLDAQVFSTTTAVSVGHVKGSWWGFADAAVATVYITEVSSGSPDMNNIVASETIDLSVLPLYDFTGPVSNTFSCDPTINVEQVVEFDPPASLNGTTEYAIVIKYASGTVASDVVAWPYEVPAPGTDAYTGGLPFECNVPTACAELTPATWDIPNSCANCNYELAIFDNVIVPDEGVTVDSWIIGWIDRFGFNSPMGKLLIAIVAMAVVFLILIAFKIPMIFAMAISGMSSTVGFAVLIIEPWMILAMVAIVGLGAMFLIYRLFSGGGDMD